MNRDLKRSEIILLIITCIAIPVSIALGVSLGWLLPEDKPERKFSVDNAGNNSYGNTDNMHDELGKVKFDHSKRADDSDDTITDVTKAKPTPYDSQAEEEEEEEEIEEQTDAEKPTQSREIGAQVGAALMPNLNCECEELCPVLGGERPVHGQGHLTDWKPKQTFIPKDIAKQVQNYPYMVSLSAPLWSDDPLGPRMFQCSGVLLSAMYVLTGQCVGVTEWTVLQVRAGTDFWSWGGVHTNIANFTHYRDGFVVVQLSPPFELNNVIKPVELMTEPAQPWTRADIIGWERNPRSPQMARSLQVTSVHSDQMLEAERASSEEALTVKCGDGNIGQPLIVEGRLLAMKTGRGCTRHTVLKNDLHGFQHIPPAITHRYH